MACIGKYILLSMNTNFLFIKYSEHVLMQCEKRNQSTAITRKWISRVDYFDNSDDNGEESCKFEENKSQKGKARKYW